MVYGKNDEEVKIPNPAPIEFVPLEEAFKEDVYNLFKAYRVEPNQPDYYLNS